MASCTHARVHRDRVVGRVREGERERRREGEARRGGKGELALSEVTGKRRQRRRERGLVPPAGFCVQVRSFLPIDAYPTL
jgi:hypothetical protein